VVVTFACGFERIHRSNYMLTEDFESGLDELRALTGRAGSQ
jgi:hypothetical protein